MKQLMESSVAPARFKMHRVPSDVLKLITQLLDVKELGRCSQRFRSARATASAGSRSPREAGEGSWSEASASATERDSGDGAALQPLHADDRRTIFANFRQRCRCRKAMSSTGPGAIRGRSTAPARRGVRARAVRGQGRGRQAGAGKERLKASSRPNRSRTCRRRTTFTLLRAPQLSTGRARWLVVMVKAFDAPASGAGADSL